MNNVSTPEIYTCPMHPEVRQNMPGRCPKCGMELVPSNNIVTKTNSGSHNVSNYIPLIVIILLIVIVSSFASWNDFRMMGQFYISGFIVHFMTGFFLVFAAFKLMDLKGFTQGYSTYDLLAGRFFAYGYVYPFVELTFGLLMLSGFHPDWLLWTEFGLMAFSGLGVARKLARREKFQCACLGTFFKAPLTYITLIEDFGMAILALVLIFLR